MLEASGAMRPKLYGVGWGPRAPVQLGRQQRSWQNVACGTITLQWLSLTKV